MVRLATYHFELPAFRKGMRNELRQTLWIRDTVAQYAYMHTVGAARHMRCMTLHLR